MVDDAVISLRLTISKTGAWNLSTAPNGAVYKGMHKKAKQSKITAFFTVTPSTIHSTSIMLINFQQETPTQMTACLLSHLASKLIAKCKVFTRYIHKKPCF